MQKSHSSRALPLALRKAKIVCIKFDCVLSCLYQIASISHYYDDHGLSNKAWLMAYLADKGEYMVK